jgi:hypothetical protein
VWISPRLWFYNQVEIITISVPLSLSVALSHPTLAGIKLYIHSVCSNSGSSFTYCHEDQTIIRKLLSFDIRFQVTTVGIIHITPISLSPFLFHVSCSSLHTYSPQNNHKNKEPKPLCYTANLVFSYVFFLSLVVIFAYTLLSTTAR